VGRKSGKKTGQKGEHSPGSLRSSKGFPEVWERLINTEKKITKGYIFKKRKGWEKGGTHDRGGIHLASH